MNLLQQLLSQIDWNVVIPALVAWFLGLFGVGGGIVASLGVKIPTAQSSAPSVAEQTAAKLAGLDALQQAHEKLGTPADEVKAIVSAAATKAFVPK